MQNIGDGLLPDVQFRAVAVGGEHGCQHTFDGGGAVAEDARMRHLERVFQHVRASVQMRDVEFRRLVAGTLVPAEVAVVAPLRRLFDWLESASTHIADVDVVHIAGILNDEAHR